MSNDHARKWEERWHPLRREWVIVAAHRQDRPWDGAIQDRPPEAVPSYDPDCYFCPGNRRVSGIVNPNYTGVFVFDNDHPSVGESAPADLDYVRAPYASRPARGVARVVSFHPRHDLSLSRLRTSEVAAVVRCWADQYRELGARADVEHVLIFENRGRAVGVSNPHPHGQIYATNFVFKTIENEAAFSRDYYKQHRRSLLGDMIQSELDFGGRIVASNDAALAFVPYCARWAYEVFVAPRRCMASVADLESDEIDAFAAVLREVLIRYDNLWQLPFPYVMVLHNAPTDGDDHAGFHFHVELHPPLRKPDLLKHLAGPEIGGGSFLSDTWPEDKAAELRGVSETHYADD